MIYNFLKLPALVGRAETIIHQFYLIFLYILLSYLSFSNTRDFFLMVNVPAQPARKSEASSMQYCDNINKTK